MTQHYTKEFRLQAARLVTEQGYSYAEVSQRLGPTSWSVRNWVRQFRQSGELPTPEHGPSSADELGEDIRDEAMNEVRRAHFVHSRNLIGQFKGREIKTIGDSFMTAFKSVDSALDYALALHDNTGQLAAQTLLGSFSGVLHCDRWSGYNIFEGMRQLCWAHLKRDFQALSETKGTLGRLGGELWGLAKHILGLRKRVRDGTLLWKTFQTRMEPLMRRVETLLERGADSGQPLSGQCRRIFNMRRHLWTFVRNAKVEPTNNRAERIIRQAVLWRKGSLGTQSERGARYAERILSVCATCRLQGQSIIAYLRDACQCHRDGLPIPSLVPTTTHLARIA